MDQVMIDFYNGVKQAMSDSLQRLTRNGQIPSALFQHVNNHINSDYIVQQFGDQLRQQLGDTITQANLMDSSDRFVYGVANQIVQQFQSGGGMNQGFGNNFNQNNNPFGGLNNNMNQGGFGNNQGNMFGQPGGFMNNNSFGGQSGFGQPSFGNQQQPVFTGASFNNNQQGNGPFDNQNNNQGSRQGGWSSSGFQPPRSSAAPQRAKFSSFQGVQEQQRGEDMVDSVNRNSKVVDLVNSGTRSTTNPPKFKSTKKPASTVSKKTYGIQDCDIVENTTISIYEYENDEHLRAEIALAVPTTNIIDSLTMAYCNSYLNDKSRKFSNIIYADIATIVAASREDMNDLSRQIIPEIIKLTKEKPYYVQLVSICNSLIEFVQEADISVFVDTFIEYFNHMLSYNFESYRDITNGGGGLGIEVDTLEEITYLFVAYEHLNEAIDDPDVVAVLENAYNTFGIAEFTNNLERIAKHVVTTFFHGHDLVLLPEDGNIDALIRVPGAVRPTDNGTTLDCHSSINNSVGAFNKALADSAFYMKGVRIIHTNFDIDTYTEVNIGDSIYTNTFSDHIVHMCEEQIEKNGIHPYVVVTNNKNKNFIFQTSKFVDGVFSFTRIA